MSAPTPAILQAPDSSGMVSKLARDWAVQVNTGTKAAPVWLFVRGLTKVDPTTDATTQDDSDIHAGGWKSGLSTMMGATLALEGLRKGEEDPNFVVDPGQEFLRAKGQLMGAAGRAELRIWRTDELPNSFRATYDIVWKDIAGSMDGLQTFTVTGTGCGKPQDVPKPTVDGE